MKKVALSLYVIGMLAAYPLFAEGTDPKPEDETGVSLVMISREDEPKEEESTKAEEALAINDEDPSDEGEEKEEEAIG